MVLKLFFEPKMIFVLNPKFLYYFIQKRTNPKVQPTFNYYNKKASIVRFGVVFHAFFLLFNPDVVCQ